MNKTIAIKKLLDLYSDISVARHNAFEPKILDELGEVRKAIATAILNLAAAKSEPPIIAYDETGPQKACVCCGTLSPYDKNRGAYYCPKCGCAYRIKRGKDEK